jgi:hypothetical protein
MAQTEERVLFYIPELAKQFGSTTVAVRRLVERGVLPSRRLGKRLVILAAELDEFLKALPSGALSHRQQPERRGGADTRHESPLPPHHRRAGPAGGT